MPADRFFVKTSLTSGQIIKIEGLEFHHLVHVMRTAIGDIVEIVNGSGVLAEGTLQSIEKKSASIYLDKIISQSTPPFQIILAQAIPRSNRLDCILEKGTELGMTQLWLFPGARSEKKITTLERLNSVTTAAMKQCGRLDLPHLELHPELKKWTTLPFPAFYGDLNPSAPTFEKAWKENPPQGGAIIFIGPESGFNEDETKKLQSLGAQGVRLHSNILRTDTAAVAALTLIHHWLLL